VDVWTQEFTVHDLNEKSPIYLQSEKPYS
jgi:hypothetical protein